MPRLRLYDMRLSRLSTCVGICQGDQVGLAEIVNAAQLRLITGPEAGNQGWWGSWAEAVFNVSRNSPDITTGRDVARVTDLEVCNQSVPIQNPFYEYLRFGVGRQPNRRTGPCQYLEAYDRGMQPANIDLPANTFVRVYPTSDLDGGQRTLIQGLDLNGEPITTLDGYNVVRGIFLSPASPFVDAPPILSKITGIQKDVTIGAFQYFAVDSGGNQTPLLTMQPDETVASYRRYFVNGLPRDCGGCKPIQVKGMVKFELIPVQVDTDYLLIQNSEAIIEECQAIRLSRSDDPRAKAAARLHHKNAISFLRGEIVHYLGKDEPAVNCSPFGSARLECVKIGMV